MVPETRPSRSLTINHTSILELLGSARASVPARYSASRPLAERASLGLCAGTRHPEQRFTVHRSRAMACLAIGAPLSRWPSFAPASSAIGMLTKAQGS